MSKNFLKKDVKAVLHGKHSPEFTNRCINMIYSLVDTMGTAANSTKDMDTFAVLKTGFDKSLARFQPEGEQQ